MNTPKSSMAFSIKQFLIPILMILVLTACSSPEEKAQKYYLKGMELLEEGETEKAKIEFKNALQIKKNMNDALFGLVLAFEKEGDWQKVFTLANQVIEQDPKHVKGLIKVGSLYLAAGKLDKAVEISLKLGVLAPEESDVLSYRAAVALKSGDTNAALELANRALAKDPKNTEAVVVLASERIAAGDKVKAIAILDAGIAKDPKNVGLYMMKIAALDDASQVKEAEAIYFDLIKNNPQKPAFRKALAAFYIKHNDMANAEKQLREIVNLEPKDFQAKKDVVSLLNSTKGSAAAKQELESMASKYPKDFEIKFLLVTLYQQLLDRAAAEKLLLEIIESDESKEIVLRARGLLAAKYLNENKKTEALKIVDEILSQDSRNEQALLLKANYEVENKQYETAIAHLRTILSDAPNSSKALVALGKTHELSGSYELADEHYLKAIQSSKLAPEYVVAYAGFLQRRNQLEREEKVILDGLAINQNNLDLLKMLASVKVNRGDWEGAQEVAETIKHATNNPALADQVMGAIFAGQKNYAESITAFKRAYDAKPSEAQPLAALVRAYMIAGKSDEAVQFLRKLIDSNKQNYAAQYLLAQVYTEKKDFPAAIQTYQTIVAQAPKAGQAHQQLAVLYASLGKLEESNKALDNGLSTNPDNPNLLYIKAGLLESNGKIEDALKIYEALYQKYPEAELIINNLASLLADNRTDKTSLNRAYEMAQNLTKSESAFLQDTVGWAAYKVGRFNESLNALQIATSKMPEVAIFHYHLAKAHLALLNKAEAKKSLEKALSLDKEQKLPKEEINKLLKEIG